jgi:hypothetical protein
MTPVAILPAVSTTPVVDFATNFASVVDTGGKFATGGVLFYRWQTMGTSIRLLIA